MRKKSQSKRKGDGAIGKGALSGMKMNDWKAKNNKNANISFNLTTWRDGKRTE